MLARVCSRSESSATAYARLFSTRLGNRRGGAKKSSKVEKSKPSLSGGTFGGESLKLRSGSHYIKCLDDAIDLFDDMVRSHPFPSPIDFSKVIGVVVKMERPDVAISLYQKMGMRRIPFDIYSFNILMKCFCDCHKLSFALSTFGKITKLGFHPDVVTFNTLLHGLCLQDRISEAVALFDHMVETRFTPSVVTFNTLIHGLCLQDRISEAVALYDHMVETRLTPDVVTFNILMNGLCMEGRVLEATALLDRMVEEGHEPNEVTYGTIVNGLCMME